MKERRHLVPAFLIALLVAAGITVAQTPANPNTVYVPVAVTGPKNVFVTGLQKDHFRLMEDGIEQTITDFRAIDEGMDLNLILAMTQLQRGRADLNSQKIREALENFRQQSNPKNKYTIEEMPFGANGIFDAISRHITNLTETSTNPHKALLVLTDGFEASAGDPGRALQEYAKKLSVPIYIVFAQAAGELTQDLQELQRGERIYLSGGAVYEDLAKFTGGRLYQAEADTQLKRELEDLAAELKSQYILGFRSTNDARNDKWRKLEVKIKAPEGFNGIKEKDLKTKVRDRYFVAKPS